MIGQLTGSKPRTIGLVLAGVAVIAAYRRLSALPLIGTTLCRNCGHVIKLLNKNRTEVPAEHQSEERCPQCEAPVAIKIENGKLAS